MTALFTQADRLLELAERVEKATGPDRELDVAIATAVFNLEWKPYCARARKMWGFKRGTDRTIVYGEEGVKPYTAALDAAMTLVPEGAPSKVMKNDAGRGFAEVGFDNHDACGRTPALALTAAALRARASLPDAAEGRG